MKLQQCIDRYVDDKQAMGLAFLNGNRNLNAFYRSVGDISLDTIRPEQILRFLDSSKACGCHLGPQIQPAPGILSLLVGAGQNALATHAAPASSSKTNILSLHLLASRSSSSSKNNADISSESGLQSSAMRHFAHSCSFSTAQAFSLARRCGSRVNDVDFIRKLVVIRNNRLEPSREIPLGPDLIQALRSYCKANHEGTSKEQHFFLDKRRKP
jgi:integrase